MNIFILLIIFAVLIGGNILAFRYIKVIGNTAAWWILTIGVVLVDVIVIWQVLERLGIPDVRV